MKEYVYLEFDQNSEAMIGLLSGLEFDSFEEAEEGLKAYIDQTEWNEDVKSQVDEYTGMLNLSYKVHKLENINWNEKWESNFQPVEVGNFCRIRADFHEPKPEFEHEVLINPKMAFGTGHHETTYMMIEQMSKLDMDKRSVFDFGCGTGILAILSKMLGAKEVYAIDIERESYLNTMENAKVNDVHFVVEQNILSKINFKKYDYILANINRQVLLDSAFQLSKILEDDGKLLISGILERDYEKVIKKFRSFGFKQKEKVQKGKWLCLVLNL